MIKYTSNNLTQPKAINFFRGIVFSDHCISVVSVSGAKAATVTILLDNFDSQSLDAGVAANLTRVKKWEKAFVEFMMVKEHKTPLVSTLFHPRMCTHSH